MTQDTVLLAIDGPVATLTLNRPHSLNALSQVLVRRLKERFAELQHNPEVKVAILTGAGRAFCAGADLDELAAADDILQAPDEEVGMGHTRFGMATFDRPVIAAVNGAAVAGGLELALCCDIRIASSTARFADTHSRVGVIPGGRMSALLPRVVGLARAKEMCLGAQFVDAATADRWGLVNSVVDADDLLPTCMALASNMARSSMDFLRTYNRLLDDSFEGTYGEAVDLEHIRSRDANQSFDREGLDVSAIVTSRQG